VQQLSRRAFTRRQRAAVTGVALVVATGVLGYALRDQWVPPSAFSPARTGFHRPELRDLATAVGGRRPFEPRLTGNFAHADYAADAPTRSAAPAATDAPLDLRIAAIALEKRAQESTDAFSVNAFGIAQLFTGRTAPAVATLERAMRLAPRDARLSSDVAAGYLVRARETNQIEDVARAVGHAKQAADLDPRLAEARFNLALSLEHLSLRHEAMRAWQAYLDLDPRSAWAREARARIERLSETPEARWEKQRREIIAAGERGDEASIRVATQQNLDTAYEYVENELIPAWADAWLAGDREKSAKNLRLARLFGQALADGVGERMPVDAALAIERAVGDQARANALARGHQIFRDARALYDQDRIADSTAAFEKAGRELAVGHSSFVAWTRLQKAISHYYQSEFDESVALLRDLVSIHTRNSHIRLAARARWMTGLIQAMRGHADDSLESYRHALAGFELVGSEADVARMHSTIADNLEAVGDLRAAWAHARGALVSVAVLQQARRREAILAAAAKIARRATFLHAAVFLQSEVVADAQRAGLAVAVVQGSLDRAEVHGLLGDEQRAAQDIAQAHEWLTRVPDKALEGRLRAETLLAQGQTLLQTAPAKALTTLRTSLAYFRQSGMEVRLPRVNLAIGRAQLLVGERRGAEQTFLEGIRALEAQRARLPKGQLRLGYYEQPWNLFEEMVKLQAASPANLPSAFLYAERFRARDLAETSSRSGPPPVVDPTSLAKRLQARTTVLYYVTLDDRLLLCVLRPTKVDFVEQTGASSALEEEVSTYRASLERGDRREIERGGVRLYDRLIRPALPLLTTGDVLVIIPDGILHALPFATLKNQQTGRYLLEEHPIHVAPSATMFERTSARLRRANTASANVVVFANPELADSDAAGLPDLSRAEAEASDIAALYTNATVLTGRNATKRAFLDNAGRFRIVHFAGHALANEQYALLSRLLLARDDPRESGSLFAHEILDLNLDTADLVVLAACRTGAGAIKKGEGPLSLARPFLAAGVPSVVATLWDVSDEASRALFAAFYRNLRGGSEPVIALRDAQLRLLRGPDANLQSPAAWAPFISVGGVHPNGGL
jgi:CHAT domain-containing protein